MRKLFLVSMLCLLAQTALATDVKTYSLGASTDFAAPVVANRANLSAAGAGAIVYDTTSNAFYGLPPGQDPVTGNWSQLSVGSGTNPVSSGSANQRIESVVSTAACTSGNCTVVRATAGFVNAITHTGPGAYSVTFAGTPFTNTPACVCTAGVQSDICEIGGSPTNTGFVFATYSLSAATYVNSSFNIICTGD